jgi:adenylate kinase
VTFEDTTCKCEMPRAGSSSRLVVVMFGAPGSGKGTQCSRIARLLKTPHISSGDILRQHATKLRADEREVLTYGGLVSDELVFSLLLKRIGAPDCSSGFILDGFPRTVAQVNLLERHLCTSGALRFDRVVIQLLVGRASLLQRLSGRRLCTTCGAVFNIGLMNLSSEICPIDGASLIRRADDRDEVVTERLQLYERQMASILNYYSSTTTILAINGDNPVDVVTSEILDVLALVLPCQIDEDRTKSNL